MAQPRNIKVTGSPPLAITGVYHRPYHYPLYRSALSHGLSSVPHSHVQAYVLCGLGDGQLHNWRLQPETAALSGMTGTLWGIDSINIQGPNMDIQCQHVI